MFNTELSQGGRGERLTGEGVVCVCVCVCVMTCARVMERAHTFGI